MRRTCAGLGVLLACGLLAALARPAAAQPAATDDSLYLTLAGGCYDDCGGQFDYFWTATPLATPGKAPLTVSTPAYSPYHANVDHSPEKAFSYTGPGELKVSVGCEVPDAAGFTWDIRLIAGEVREDFDDAFTGCSPDVQTFVFNIDLTGAVVEGDRGIHMSISVNGINPQVGSTSQVFLIADDPARPTAIFAPWTLVSVETQVVPVDDQGNPTTNGTTNGTSAVQAGSGGAKGSPAGSPPVVLIALGVAAFARLRRG